MFERGLIKICQAKLWEPLLLPREPPGCGSENKSWILLQFWMQLGKWAGDVCLRFSSSTIDRMVEKLFCNLVWPVSIFSPPQIWEYRIFFIVTKLVNGDLSPCFLVMKNSWSLSADDLITSLITRILCLFYLFYGTQDMLQMHWIVGPMRLLHQFLWLYFVFSLSFEDDKISPLN